MAQTVLEKIYDKFDKLKKEAEEDCYFDKSNLDTAFNNTNLIIKYINSKMEWTRVLRKYEAERKEAYRTSYQYYQTEFNLKLSSKEEYQIFIESDPSYVDVFSRCQVVKEVTLYIDSVLDALKGRGFEIKHCLEYLKFQQGL